MEKSLKLVLLSSLISLATGANAAITSNTMHFTGAVTPTLENCEISAQASIDLGSVEIADAQSAAPEEAFHEVPLDVRVSNCSPDQQFSMTLSGQEDSNNSHMLKNLDTEPFEYDGSGTAVGVGVIIRDSSGNIVLPNQKVTLMANDNGELNQTFSASMARSGQAAPAQGHIDVTATIVLDVI